MRPDPGDWIILLSCVLMLASTGAIAVLLAPGRGATGLALLSAASTAISALAAYGVAYLGDHHDEIEWMSGNVFGAASLLMLMAFTYGLIGAFVSARRAARRRQVNAAVLSPWVVYVVVVVLSVTSR